MKRILTVSLVGILTCILMISTMLCAVAAPSDSATVNGVSAPVGSMVEYTLNLKAEKQELVGIQMIFKYDTAKLELKDVKLDNFPSATINANNNNDGMIYFNNSDINGIDYSQTKEVAKLQFEVIASGETEIQYYIQYLYDIDLVNLYDYTLTYSLAVDGTTQIENKPPVLADADDIAKDVDANFDSGDFANNIEGTGSGIKPVVTTVAASTNNDNTTNNGGDSTAIIVISVVVIVALVAVVVLAVVKKNKAA